jgi:hypothetical protein
MYTDEQKADLFNILGGRGHLPLYWIKVFQEIAVTENTLTSILDGRYKPLIIPDSCFSNEVSLYSEITQNLRIHKLNAFVNIVKINKVPLYINTIPEIARWRLSIGV